VNAPAPAPLPLVLWDLDGTLVRLDVPRAAVDGWRARLGAVFRPFGYGGPWAPLLPCLERALAAAAGVRGAPAAAEVYAALDAWEAEALGGVEVLEGTAGAWQALGARGVPQAVVTNNGPTAAGRALDALRAWAAARGRGWVEPVAVVTRGPGLAAKPAADALERACDRAAAAGWPGCGVVVAGDRDDDAGAAAALQARRARPVVFVRARAGRLDVEPAAAALGALGLEPAWLPSESAGSTPPEAG